MNRLMFTLTYWLGQPRWDSGITPPEVIAAFAAGDIPPGAALDLGCGTGTNVIYMARQGRQAIGVDFIPQAIRQARRKADQAGVADRVQFHVGDVTRLGDLRLPPISFALDMGCFHGLDEDQRRRYLTGLSGLMLPGGRYMLYAAHPGSIRRRDFGISPETMQQIVATSFEITRMEHGSFGGREWASTWYWLTRRGV
jgi:SAM-dependent methyltransferase